MRFPQRWRLVLLALPALTGCGAADGREANACRPAPKATVSPANIPMRPNGPILDEADILPASQEATLDAHLRGYFQQTGNAIVLVSVTSLNGQKLEPFATDLYNRWGIGDARTNRGLLVLVAPNERKVRIEVGCGLEAAVPDLTASEIIQRDMLPAFREGNLERGTLAGLDALEKRLAATTARGPTSEICKCLMGVAS